MKQIYTITLIIFTAFMTGCTTVQPLPNVPIPKGAKIGFISLVDEHPKIVQVGTTILTNTIHRRAEKWDLSERLYDSLKADLSAHGYELFKLEASDTLMKNKFSLVSAGWDSFHLSDVASREIEQYGKNNNVDVVIIFSPYIHDGLRSTQGGIYGYGLIRICFLGSCKYEPFDRVRSIVATTKSPQLIGWDNYKPRPKALSISYDGNLDDLPMSELDKAKEPIVETINSDAKIALTDAGLINNTNDESNK